MDKTVIIAAVAVAGGLGLSAPSSRAQITDTPAGTYAQTCSNASVSQGRLYAQCLNMQGRRVSTSIEVAPCVASDIGNDDGLLVCHGLRGRLETQSGGTRGGNGGDRPDDRRDGRDRDRDRDDRDRRDRDRNGPGRGGPGWGGSGNGGGALVDYSLTATYGDWSFPAGYYADPLTVAVYSGGSVRASDVARDCQGWIARAPDAQITYSANGRPLIFSVASDGDTTLVINGPDGQWYCDDDGGHYGLNPALQFNQPQSGVYDVWIGSYARDRNDVATLNVSARTSQ